MNTALLVSLLKVTMLSAVVALGSSWARAGDDAKTITRSKVAFGTALSDAQRLAAVKNDLVVEVKGESMLPYFGEGAVLVVRPTTVEALRPGMVALYRNRFGELVAHRIEARGESGWVARGANNIAADSTAVTAENLLGTVYVTLYAAPRAETSGLALAETEPGAPLVALAAPAR